jgi:hypothetical protein
MRHIQDNSAVSSCRQLHVVQCKRQLFSALLLYKILEKISLPYHGMSSKDNLAASLNGVIF